MRRQQIALVDREPPQWSESDIRRNGGHHAFESWAEVGFAKIATPRALDRGCDDFLVRPFDYEELLARIRAVLRRTMPAHKTMRAGPITADLAARCVSVDGVAVAARCGSR